MSGYETLVVSASYHHLSAFDSSLQKDTCKNGVHYAFVPTSTYKGNGIGRKLSMLLFSLLLFPYCCIKAIKIGKPETIIYSSPHPFGYIGAWLSAKVLGARLVFEVRDIWPLSLIELAGMNPEARVVRLTGWIEKYAYKHSDKVVSLLPFADEHMVSRGMAPEKFVWIPNGVGELDPEQPKNGPASDLEKHVRDLKSKGCFIVIYAGSLGEPNAIQGVLEAFAILKEEKPDIRLLLVGKGELRGQLREYAERHALSNVEFHDPVDKSDVMEVLKCASAGYISLKPQPIFRFGISPNKLWDYMLARLPIIFACKAANNPVEESGCGFTVEPTDPVSIAAAINRMSELSREDLRALGDAGYRAVQAHYTYEILAKRFEKNCFEKPR